MINLKNKLSVGSKSLKKILTFKLITKVEKLKILIINFSVLLIQCFKMNQSLDKIKTKNKKKIIQYESILLDIYNRSVVSSKDIIGRLKKDGNPEYFDVCDVMFYMGSIA